MLAANSCVRRGPFSATLARPQYVQPAIAPTETAWNRAPTRGKHGRVASHHCGRIGTCPLPAGDQAVPDAGAAGGIHARQALARARRSRGRAQARHLAFAARGQDRHGLSRLRPADRRGDFRGQCRPHAGGQALRAGQGLQARDLRDVVDPRVDPGIHPALMVAGEDGHHGKPEEAVLQSAQGQEPDFGARRRRPARRSGRNRSRSGSASASRT